MFSVVVGMKTRMVKFEKSNQNVLSEPVKFTVLVLKCHGYTFSFEKHSWRKGGKKDPESQIYLLEYILL